MQSVRVRAATTSDLPDLSRLWHEKMVIYQQLDRRVVLAPDAGARWSAAAADWLSDANCSFLLAVLDDEIVGYIIGWLQPASPGLLPENIGVVTDLAVDAHRPRGGVGGVLFAALREWFIQQGVDQIITHVPARAAVEQAFWRAQTAVDWVDVMWLKL